MLASPFIRFEETGMPKLTVYLARLIGLFALSVGIGCLARERYHLVDGGSAADLLPLR